MFCFYILESARDRKLYYGSTDNLKRRVDEHQRGLLQSTSYRLPIRLVYYEAYQTLEKARLREKQVKASGSVRKALNARIQSPEGETGLDQPTQKKRGPARPPAGKPGQ